MAKLIWKKQLDEHFSLMEYEKEENLPNCIVGYEESDYDHIFFFSFGSWGMDRNDITSADCALVMDYAINYDANVSISSFASNLEYARAEEEEDWSDEEE